MAAKNEESSWLTVEEALDYLKISKTTLYACMKDGRLPFYYVKGTKQRRLARTDLDGLLVPGAAADSDVGDEPDSSA